MGADSTMNKIYPCENTEALCLQSKHKALLSVPPTASHLAEVAWVTRGTIVRPDAYVRDSLDAQKIKRFFSISVSIRKLAP
jgi:hypothetical protein